MSSEISDEEFVLYLKSLGVETFNKSFEWMLNDPSLSGVVKWIYNNFDQNNALTAHENYRYKELEKHGQLLTPEDLEASLTSIQNSHPGICLPGDKEAKEDMILNIKMQQERLDMLEKHEATIQGLIKQNEFQKEALFIELTKLKAAHQQFQEDEATTGEECIVLAQRLDTLTDEIVDVIAEQLEGYSKCRNDKESAKRFFIFNPIESYRQSQVLFRSHFDLYVSKNLMQKQKDSTNEDLRASLNEAKNMEERLFEAAIAYFESKAELSGEQAKLALVSKYIDVHPSHITSCLMETQSALELLEQEENIIEQQVQAAVEQFVHSRTRLAVDTATLAAYNVRQEILSSLGWLVETCQRALALDRLVYCRVRDELRTLEDFLQFANDLRRHVLMEDDYVASRIAAMNAICAEHELCEQKLQSKNPILNYLLPLMGQEESNDPALLVKCYKALRAKVKQSQRDVEEGFSRKENALVELKSKSQPLRGFVWCGCTKQPSRWDPTVSSLSHSLNKLLDALSNRVMEATGKFTAVKNGDKHNLRKLWQWFLADPSRFRAAMKDTVF